MTPRAIALSFAALVAACTPAHPPLQLASSVDLPRFMGRWYVIASIPTFIERDAYDAIETYHLDHDGTIDTTFTFHAGSHEGARKRYRMRAFPGNSSSNAVWGMQFVWPIRADYRIVHVSPDYAETVIGRERRDYAWIMARDPVMDEDRYQSLTRLLREQGYDTAQLRRVPHAAGAPK